MSHEPKLTVYIIKIKPANDRVENSNRCLFRNLIGEANNSELNDSFILTEVFKRFISALDTPEMFADPISRKCMTANQPNIEDPNVNPNINLHSEHCVFEGKIEGGTYGKKRNKTSTINKTVKSNVDERDAITDDFYFLIYFPLGSNKITLMVQSFSDGSIDSVMKKFWKNFLSFEGQFKKPEIKRFVPRSIINDFKTNATVSSISFSTEIPGETLLENTTLTSERQYKVTVQIKPTEEDFSIQEFPESIAALQEILFTRVLTLGGFRKKRGTLKDSTSNKTTPFELGSSFEIQPSILLSKFIEINQTEADFFRIKNYCFSLLNEIKPEIYTHNGIQER